MKSRIDILSIGDVVTDAFIKLNKEYTQIDNEKSHNPRLSVPYGAKIPFDETIVIPGVGNAANAAVSFAKLGLKSTLLAHVGDDDYGREIIHELAHKRVQTQFIQLDSNKLTNYHYVLWFEDDRTILMKHEKYNWKLPQFHSIDKPKWIYLSRLGPDTLGFHHELAKYVKNNPDIKLVFQPDRFQLEFGTEKIAAIYNLAEVMFCNREEAMLITKSNSDNIIELFAKIHKLGTRKAFITDGPNGSYGSDGDKVWSMRNYPDPKPPLDRTGAGDAYASTVTAALVMDKSLEEAMQWAPINSTSVVGAVGAQAGLLSEHQIKTWLTKAPQDYKPKLLSGGGSDV